VTNPEPAPDPGLERERRGLTRPAKWFWIVAGALELVGWVLFVLTSGWPSVLGIALAGLGLAPLVVALALSASGAVAWWSARRKPLA